MATAGGRVREPRAALCPASRCGRASPVGAAPPRTTRAPANQVFRPAPPGQKLALRRCRCTLRSRRECSSCAPPPAGARPVVAWWCALLARGQLHGIVDSRVPSRPGASRPLPLCEPCAGTTRRQCRGRRAVCASTAMACQETGEFRPPTRSASRELVRSLGLTARRGGWAMPVASATHI